MWKFAEVDGAKYLEVAANPDETGADTVGFYLGVPPDSERDESSSFLGVTSDVSAATTVSASPIAGGEYTPPAADGDYVSPDADGGYAPPVAEGDYVSPDADGEYAAPAGDGDYVSPYADGEYAPPAGDGEYAGDTYATYDS